MVADGAQIDTYQWMLRAVGAYLDQEPSCRITVTETPDGFLVRLQRALHKLEPEVLHFDRDALKEHLELLRRERRPMATSARHQGVWSNFPNSHQDFFRALGFELDEANAHSVFIDELEDGFVVTYTCPESPGSTTWTKKMVVLGVQEIETILNTAFERRRKPDPPPPVPEHVPYSRPRPYNPRSHDRRI